MNRIHQSYLRLGARTSGTPIKYGIGLGMPLAPSGLFILHIKAWGSLVQFEILPKLELNCVLTST